MTGNLSQKLHNVHNQPETTIKNATRIPFGLFFSFPKDMQMWLCKNSTKEKTLTHQIRKRSWHKVRFFTKGKVNKHVIKIEKQPFENVFSTHIRQGFLPIQKLIKGQKYRRKCVDNKSRNLFGTTAKKGGNSYAERKRWRKSFLLDSK